MTAELHGVISFNLSFDGPEAPFVFQGGGASENGSSDRAERERDGCARQRYYELPSDRSYIAAALLCTRINHPHKPGVHKELSAEIQCHL